MAAGKKKDPTRLPKKDLNRFRKVLEAQKKELLDHAREMLHVTHEDHLEQSGDEVDQSTAEYDQAFEYRLRDREKFLLKKIVKALGRIDEGTYNECEECGGTIGTKRLEARIVATLCIECKEEQEQDEKRYQKRRAYKLDFEF
jgi:DnaK suppressor protein